jgi:hypothetical protein
MRKRASLSTFVSLGILGAFASGCGDADGVAETPDAEPLATFTEDGGIYHYVLGYDAVSEELRFGGAHAVVVPAERGKEDAIDQPNKPSRLHSALNYGYLKFDAALASGETDWKVFPSNWWAQSNNGIAKRWTGGASDLSAHGDKDNLSPIEKYDLLFTPGQTVDVAEVEHWNAADVRKPEAERGPKHKHAGVKALGPATAWELQNHGIYQTYSHPDSWWGHCNGWASYATTEKLGFPQRDIRVKIDGGKVTECVGALASDPGCVLVRMGDIEALMTELYFSDKATFAGRRCNTDPEKIERDQYGRPKEAACRDLNPGSFHVGVTGLLNRGAKHLATGEQGKPAFIIDHNWDWEVWNFPVVKYQLDLAEEITAEQANQLVGATGSKYQFNSKAKKLVKVHLRYWMVSDGVGDWEMRKRADQRNIQPHEVELRYILEIDSYGRIIGGEWLKVPSTSWWENGTLKEIHPDFFWMGVNVAGWSESADDLGGNDDNPFVAYSKVSALLQCANDAASCAPGATPPPPTGPSCSNRCGTSSTDGTTTCWCDNLCTNYGDCCSDYAATCGG